MSQSPSLRGSGRFARRPRDGRGRRPGLNPLHCGAVVASRRPARRRAHARRVSIPFIAGQWSLLLRQIVNALAPGVSQSPSLRGSGRFMKSDTTTIAKVKVSIPFIAGQWSLRRPGPPRREAEHVSIPFIAGQWSLQLGGAAAGDGEAASQSPSLRGSGRFRWRCWRIWSASTGSQSPSLRGSGRFEMKKEEQEARAWSQSPSLRGSGRFKRRRARPGACGLNPLHCGAVVASELPLAMVRADLSQSPSLRGSGRFRSPPAAWRRGREEVSIPFIAGQWSLRGGGAAQRGGPH